MKITILTLFPEMYEGFLNTSIIKKAILKELVEFELIDIRSFSTNKHKRVDDAPFGGSQGLVMTYQPIVDALKSINTESSKVLMAAASGETLTQKKVRDLSKETHLVLICGHYEGIDERVMSHVDEAFSIGDYILTGGELASMVLSDAITRLLEGVIKEDSHLEESFETGLLEYPHYTRPEEIDGLEIPDVLKSGHHENIRIFRLKESLRKTWLNRPDLFKNYTLNKEETKLMIEILEESLKNT